MADTPPVVNGNVGCPPSNVHQNGAQLFLIGTEDRFRGGQLLHHHPIDQDARLIDGIDNVLHHGRGIQDQVHGDREMVAIQAQRINHPLKSVHLKVPGQTVDDLIVLSQIQ